MSQDEDEFSDHARYIRRSAGVYIVGAVVIWACAIAFFAWCVGWI